MSHVINRIYQINVPDIKPGEKFEVRMGIETTGGYEKEEARLEVVLAQGTRVENIVTPYLGYGFILHDNQRDGRTYFVGQLREDSWKPITYVRLIADEDLKGAGIRPVGEFTYYSWQGIKGVSIPVIANVITTSEVAVLVNSKVVATWKDLTTTGWVYSYEVDFNRALEHEPIESWEVSCVLPKGTQLYKQPWAETTFDQTSGLFKMFKPAVKQANEVGSTLSIAFQLLYPAALGQHPSLEKLNALKGSYTHTR